MLHIVAASTHTSQPAINGGNPECGGRSSYWLNERTIFRSFVGATEEQSLISLSLLATVLLVCHQSPVGNIILHFLLPLYLSYSRVCASEAFSFPGRDVVVLLSGILGVLCSLIVVVRFVALSCFPSGDVFCSLLLLVGKFQFFPPHFCGATTWPILRV